MALEQFQAQFDDLYSHLEHTPPTAWGIYCSSSMIHDGDSRFGFPAREEFAAITLEDVSTWLDQPLRKGCLEVAIVGDVDVDTVLDRVARTLGALPARDAWKPKFAEARARSLSRRNKIRNVDVSFSVTGSHNCCCVACG